MSFVDFLKNATKILLGYGLGGLLVIGGIVAYTMQDNPIGIGFVVIGFVIMLFAVYTEREMKRGSRPR